MNFLEEEITSALETNHLKIRQLKNEELEEIISNIKTCFFGSSTKNLDPCNLQSATKQHDPDYWKKVDFLYRYEKPTLIALDNQVHVWELQSSSDLRILLSETTGFPFWITNAALSFLTYVDDHDCVHTAAPLPPPAIKQS